MVLPQAAGVVQGERGGARMTVLLVGDDWAADHHDVELMDHGGRVLARARLSEADMARLHHCP